MNVQRTRIKFCGITRAQDAIAAVDAGADAIGLIFYRNSPRYITIEMGQAIVNQLPPFVMPTALFVNSRVDEIRSIVDQLNIRSIQLHGDEPVEILNDLAEFTVIKAIRTNDTVQLKTWHKAAGILLETSNTREPGGNGIENDWYALESITKSDKIPMIAAGGLTPENVNAVVKKLRPYAVDVSTGIEISPGIKSPEKMNRFVQQVREADLHV